MVNMIGLMMKKNNYKRQVDPVALEEMELH